MTNSAPAQERRLRSVLADSVKRILDDPGLVSHQFDLVDQAAKAALDDEALVITAKRADQLDDEAMESLQRFDGEAAWVLAQAARWIAEHRGDQLVAANAWKHLSAACTMLNWPEQAVHCLKQMQSRADAV